MKLAAAFCLFIIFGNLQSQKLIGFEVSKCLTDCKFEKSTIEELKISKGQTEISLRTLANCSGEFVGKVEQSESGVVNLIFDIKPTEGIDRQGKKSFVIEVADCDCPFDFTFKIDGFELQDPSLIRVNGLQLSELPESLVEEIQVNMDVDAIEGAKVEHTEIKPSKVEEEDTNQILTIAEEQAAPVGGRSAFYKYVREEMRYPEQARKMQIEGRVFCEFVVNRDGSIQDVQIIRGIGAGCDEEAIRLIQASAPWTPAQQRGKIVRSKFNLAIIFKLDQIKE